MNIAIAVIVIVAVFLMFRARLKQGARDSTFLIKSPRLGILNLKGESARTMIAEDKEAISGPFSSVEERADTAPKCDVLFVYCDFAEDGTVVGNAAGLRDLIRDSGAYVAVVASENPTDACVRAAKATGYGHANLMLTSDRKGGVFPAAYRQVFDQMAKGVSMPVALAKLAPPIPGDDPPNFPSGVFFIEAGQVAFEYGLGAVLDG